MIKTNITELFGIKYPIFSAPMGPFFTRDLALAVSEKGGLGVLSNVNIMGTDPVVEHKKSLEFLSEHTDKPFGFNILTSRNNIGVKEMCRDIPQFIMENAKIKEQCRYVLTSAGSSRILPGSQSFKKLKNDTSSQIQHFHVTPALWLANKAINPKEGPDFTVDGIVCTGGEGGGHQSYEKVSTLVLLQQIKKAFPDIPKIACGGFATGEGLAAALSLGAGAIAMGSRFIASKQSEFHENYKAIVPSGVSQDTDLYTGSFGPIRLYHNEYSKTHPAPRSKAEMVEHDKYIRAHPEEFLKDSNAYDRVYDGDTTTGAVLLGQSIGIINSIDNVDDIIDRVMKEAEDAIRKNSQMLI
ncbi:MAG: NAD(P)H-dependent flavin oxidoreductase [Promethearchaeota archaeon]